MRIVAFALATCALGISMSGQAAFAQSSNRDFDDGAAAPCPSSPSARRQTAASISRAPEAPIAASTIATSVGHRVVHLTNASAATTSGPSAKGRTSASAAMTNEASAKARTNVSVATISGRSAKAPTSASAATIGSSFGGAPDERFRGNDQIAFREGLWTSASAVTIGRASVKPQMNASVATTGAASATLPTNACAATTVSANRARRRAGHRSRASASSGAARSSPNVAVRTTAAVSRTIAASK